MGKVDREGGGGEINVGELGVPPPAPTPRDGREWAERGVELQGERWVGATLQD